MRRWEISQDAWIARASIVSAFPRPTSSRIAASRSTIADPGRWAGPAEAAEWARHFGTLESDMDRLLAELFHVPFETLLAWSNPGRYVNGRELAEAGLAELIDLKPLELMPRKQRNR